MKKGERKKEENYIKKGEKGLKNASFCRRREKKLISKEGGGMIRMHNLYPCWIINERWISKEECKGFIHRVKMVPNE